jgi:hypothetical protein
MATIRIRFVASPTFIGSAIRWVTDSIFNHVEFGTPEGTWIGAHVHSGIQERPANYAVVSREYVYEIPCTDEQQALLLKWARSKIGTKYNRTDILGLLIKNRKLTTPHQYICSQFCIDGLLFVFGARRVLNVLTGFSYLVTPEMLHLSPIFVGNLVKRVG